MDADEIGRIVQQFLSNPRCLLFAGAGVGRRVGLPSWHTWIEGLAQICRQYSENTAALLIEERLAQGNYIGAATIYKTCESIPAGERLRRMAEAFKLKPGEEVLEQLEPLVKLPLAGIITTNYDRTLHDTYALFHRRTAQPLELHDRSLRNGALISEFFIARIHGRCEQPHEMVVDSSDYVLVEKDPDYLDFVVTCLRERPTLFLGFSFVDPAIRTLMDIYKVNFGPNFPAMHLAIIPQDQGSMLSTMLSELNIRVITYDPEEEHKNLWRSVRCAYDATLSQQLTLNLPATLPRELPASDLHRIVAFAYARSKTPGIATKPALEMVQDGVLLSILDDEPSSHLEKEVAIERIRDLLRLERSLAEELFNKSLERLVASGDISVTSRYIARRAKAINLLGEHLRQLARGVDNRLRVIKARKLQPVEIDALSRLWEELFIMGSGRSICRFGDYQRPFNRQVRSRAVEPTVRYRSQYSCSRCGGLPKPDSFP